MGSNKMRKRGNPANSSTEPSNTGTMDICCTRSVLPIWPANKAKHPEASKNVPGNMAGAMGRCRISLLFTQMRYRLTKRISGP